MAAMDRRTFLATAAAGALSGAARGQEPKGNFPPPGKLSTPSQAVFWAMADAGAAGPGGALYYRYVWIPTGDRAAAAITNYTVNSTITTARTIESPRVLAGGRLLRYDLSRLCPLKSDLDRALRVWDTKQSLTEPYFLIREKTREATKAYVAADGKTYSHRDKFTWDFGLHADRANGRTLSFLTTGDLEALHVGKSCPIVRYDWFMSHATTSIDGGLYYDWLGLERKPAKGTAQASFLARIGADEAESVDRDHTSSRAALLRSGVTGKRRRVEAFYGRKARPTDVIPIAFVTHDITDEDRQVEAFDPIRNLAFFLDRAREIIQPRQNGLFEYGLFDAAGALQDFVPDNIAKDHEIPRPYTAKLNGMLSCNRCHGRHDGLIPFDNSVPELLGNEGLKFFGDNVAAARGQDYLEAMDILKGQYSGDLEPVMMAVRNAHAQAAFRATGGMQLTDVSGLLVSTCDHYNYGPGGTGFGADDACQELGLEYEADGDARQKAKAAGRRFKAAVPKLVVGAPFSPEDPLIGALALGLRVDRRDWEKVYKDVALRAMATALLETQE